MKGLAVRTIDGWRPFDQDAINEWRKHKPGDCVTVDVRRPRNGKHHRKLFALAKIVIDNAPEQFDGYWPEPKNLIDELKMQCGLTEIRRSVGGKTYYVPRSISFGAMSQGEFEKFYEQCIRFVCRHIIPGIDDDELREAVANEIAGF